MDPISAAGIGLSITSLVLQVFTGCVKGYQLFLEVEGMPASYEHLRICLELEQARLLNWGDKVGLVEESLGDSGRDLRLNQGLVLDTLLHVQKLFRESLKINAKYETTARPGPLSPLVNQQAGVPQSRTFVSRSNRLLTKTLAKLEKAPQVATRLKWAMLDQDNFETLVKKLIGLNNSIESLLDRAALVELQATQHHTNMIMLQLTNKIDELKTISLAMQVKTIEPPDFGPTSFSRSSTLVNDDPSEHKMLAELADFKAKQIALDMEQAPASMKPTNISEIDFLPNSNHSSRPVATFKNQAVWVEWKYYELDKKVGSTWNQVIEDRVKKLAILLGSSPKPKEFRSPHCLGYFDDRTKDYTRYGFIYKAPGKVANSNGCISLRDAISKLKKPSLTNRVGLACKLASALMYLHSVNWLHKSFRSDSVVFLAHPETGKIDRDNPILAGFGYARPDQEDEPTEQVPSSLQEDVYRHPDLLDDLSCGSKKSYDIYSFGVVLIEIAHWKTINDIVGIIPGQKGGHAKALQIRNLLLSHKEDYMANLKGSCGRVYSEVVRRCLSGGQDIGIPAGGDETDVTVGAEIQRVFYDEIVGKLDSIKI